MSVNVGTATGYLDLDISGFLSGLKSANSEATKKVNNLSTSIGKGFETVGSKLTSAGKTLTTAITAPIAAGVTSAVKEFADLEQAIGGVETLFKGSAGTVIKNSETAYMRAGSSATNYMEQVTSFSARLLQSTGGDTERAAKIADMAMVDMSDNANKFGTNIGSIQDAYQGFAKDNYTMLDNLKLGYGGTKTEMERLLVEAGKISGIEYNIDNLSDVYEAVHVIQNELGITGTTALEATETVSGAFGMAKASVKDFLAQLGQPGADMEKFKQNMIDSIKVVIDNVKRVLGTMWENIPLEGWQKNLIAAMAAAGPLLLTVGKISTGIGGMLTTLGKMPGLVTKAAEGFTNISKGFQLAKTSSFAAGAEVSKLGAALAGITAPIAAIIAAVAVLAAAFVTLWKTNEEFREKMLKIWGQIKDTFTGFIDEIKSRFEGLGISFEGITDTLWAIWKGFTDLLAPPFEGAFQQISNIIKFVLDVIIGVLDVFIGIFTGNWEQAWEGVKSIFSSIWEYISSTFSNVLNVMKGILDAVLGWFGTTWEKTWSGIKQFFVNIWKGISSFFTNMIGSIKTATSNFITSITNFFAELPKNISKFIQQAWQSVVEWSTNMVNKAKETGKNFLNNIVEFFTDLPYKVGYFIGSTLANVVLWVTNMVSKAKEMGTNFLNTVVSFFTQLPGKVKQFIDSTYENAKTWATNMVNKAKEMGTNFLNNVVSFFTQLPGKVKGFIDSTFENVKTWATNMANKAKEMGTNFLNNVVSFFTQLPGKIKEQLDKAITNVVTWVSGMGKKGKEAATSLINGVIGGARNIPSQMASIGRNIVDGVWNGIRNARNTFVSNVKGFFSGIVGGVKSALGIKSPSKVFADEIGRWLPPGVADGFAKSMPAATKKIQTILSNTVKGLGKETDNIDASFGVEGFESKLKGLYTNVALWFESIDERIGNSINNMKEDLRSLIQLGSLVISNDGTLGYVGYGGFSKTAPSEGKPKGGDPTPASSEGDTFNFYSPKPIDEIEAANQLKKTKRDLSEGF